jgi:hypothetical protein
VFDFVADERNEPCYNPRILRVHKLTPGPIGQGTRFRAETTTMRRAAGSRSSTRPTSARRLGSSIRMSAADIQGTLTFDPIDGGTRMGWLWDLRLRGWYRLLTSVIARSGQRLEQATWASLKQYLEGQRDRVPQPR